MGGERREGCRQAVRIKEEKDGKEHSTHETRKLILILTREIDSLSHLSRQQQQQEKQEKLNIHIHTHALLSLR